MCGRFQFYGNRNTGYPHVFLIHAVGNPQVTIGRYSVSFLNATGILRAVRFVIPTITHRRNLTMHQVQSRIFQTIFAQGDCQWPAKFRRIIHGSIHTVAQTLPPDFRITVDKTFGTKHRLRPGMSAIFTDGSQGMFPKTGNTPIG